MPTMLASHCGSTSRAEFSSLHQLLLSVLFLLLSGCPVDEESFFFELNVVHRAADGTVLDYTLAQGDFDLRFTFLKRSGLRSALNLRDYDLICDRVFRPKDNVEIAVPLQDNVPLSLLVEAFDVQTHKLRYAGALERFEISPAREKATVNLYPTPGAPRPPGASNGVTPFGTSRRPRAFHSATLLPNGEVLLVGGLVSVDNAPFKGGAILQATNEVEVFNPYRNPLEPPSEDNASPHFNIAVADEKNPISARAFHQAVLLPSPIEGPYDLLLIGGVQPAGGDPSKPACDLRNGIPKPFLFSPYLPPTDDPSAQAVAAPAGILTYVPASVGNNPAVSYRALPSFPKGMFPRLILEHSTKQAVIAPGGTDFTRNTGFLQTSPVSWLSLKQPLAETNNMPQITITADPKRIRVGHTIGRFADNGYLILGGNMNGDLSDVGEAGSTIRAFDTVSLDNPSAIQSTAWHTLTALGQNDLQLSTPSAKPSDSALWAGGYVLADELSHLRFANREPRDSEHSLYLIRWPQGQSQPALIPIISSTGDFQPAGYHQASRLGDGSVLFSGGNYSCAGAGIAYCARDQLVIYSSDGSSVTLRQFDDPKPKLTVPRYGHQATRLLDGLLLITGGMAMTITDPSSKEYQLEFSSQAEMINVREASPEDDYPLGRQPDQDTGETKDRCPIHIEESP